LINTQISPWLRDGRCLLSLLLFLLLLLLLLLLLRRQLSNQQLS
jgi:hypothetical protein